MTEELKKYIKREIPCLSATEIKTLHSNLISWLSDRLEILAFLVTNYPNLI